MISDAMLDRYMAARRRIILVAPPGCGKTARILDCARRNGRRVIVMRASLSERVDFGGCLVPDVAAGVTRALPLDVLLDLQTTQEPTLLFLDDLGQAPTDVQAALMRLFDKGALSEHVLIWGATNRPGDRAGVSSLCEPLRSRFNLAFAVPTPETTDDPGGPVLLNTWQEELAGWVNWALDHDAPGSVIAFHRSTGGQNLYAWQPNPDPALRMPDYRTWENVIALLNDGIDDLASLAASIGKPAAAAFLAFSALTDKIPSPDQVWMDPNGAPVPTDPGALYLVASSLSLAATEKHARPLMIYIDRLPRVYGALCAKDALRRLDKKLSGRPEWVKWFTENQELFTS